MRLLFIPKRRPPVAGRFSYQGYDKYTIVEYPDPKGEWWEELLMASSNVKQSLIKSELGEALPDYEALKQVKKLSPVQCRMEYIVVE